MVETEATTVPIENLESELKPTQQSGVERILERQLGIIKYRGIHIHFPVVDWYYSRGSTSIASLLGDRSGVEEDNPFHPSESLCFVLQVQVLL